MKPKSSAAEAARASSADKITSAAGEDERTSSIETTTCATSFAKPRKFDSKAAAEIGDGCDSPTQKADTPALPRIILVSGNTRWRPTSRPTIVSGRKNSAKSRPWSA